MSLGFVEFFGITVMESKMVHGHKRDQEVPCLCGSEIWAILCVIVGKK